MRVREGREEEEAKGMRPRIKSILPWLLRKLNIYMYRGILGKSNASGT